MTEKNATQWRPIEIAPKDGTSILAVVAGIHTRSGEPFVPEVVEWDVDSASWWNCMWECHECYSNKTNYAPTHWMPLPPAPNLEPRHD